MCCESCQLLGFAAVSQEQCVTLLLQQLHWKQSSKQGQECCGLESQIYLRCVQIHSDSRFFALWKAFGKTGLEDKLFGSLPCLSAPSLHRYLSLPPPPFLMVSDTHKYTKIWQVYTGGNDLFGHHCLSVSLPSLWTVYPFPWALTRASVVTFADENILPENILAFFRLDSWIVYGHRMAVAFQECRVHRCWQARLAWGRLNSHCSPTPVC